MSLSVTSSAGPTARSASRFLQNRAAIIGLVLLVPLLVAVLTYPLWLPYKPNDIDLLAMNSGPGWKHWFGTDGVGRDVFARTMEGGRISLLVAVSSVVLSTSIGFLIGAISALGGRWADAIAMRSVDLAMTLPPVIFFAGAGLHHRFGHLVHGRRHRTPFMACVVPHDPCTSPELREREFVMASRGMGAGLRHLLFRHGLPNSIDILVVYATLQVANAILLEAGLSFLGLGVPPPAASWGNMLNAARSTAVLEQFPWQWMFPGARLCWPYWRSTSSAMV